MTDFPCCADLSKFIGKPFCWKTYNCWQFVVDFYAHAGIELKDYTPKDLSLSTAQGAFEGSIKRSGFKKVNKPSYGDVVLFKSRHAGQFHVGVWVGDVLHCASRFKGAGQVMREEMFFIRQRFQEVTYWRWEK